MRAHLRRCLSACVAAAVGALAPQAAWAVEPHLSMTTLSSSNGLGAVVYDATQYKITEFLEHPYQAASSTTSSRNFAYDSYPGIRIGSTGTWLNTVVPAVIEYLPATGIIHTQRTLQGVTIDEYDFAPMGLTQNASVILVKVTQTGTAGPIDLYSLFNYQVGSGNPPGTDSETADYDSANDAYYLTGPSGIAMAFTSITSSSYHGCTPNNPFSILTAGGNLDNDPGTGGATTGAVEGFQSSLGSLTSGTSAWAGWVTVLAPDANGASAIATTRTWINGRTASQILSDEQTGWASWIQPAPSGASSTEAALDQQSQAMIRMGQVTESGQGNGQILAAVTPGEWNISWVRDMAYSTVALVKSGHYTEAKAALSFQMNATAGTYASYLATTDGGAGTPYQISVCRYYGNGTEWSDSNPDGPNVEFDGFGLFLWSLDEYVRASGDTATLTSWWPTIKSKIAGVLVDLQESSTGMIVPDSSIWEVHWDGQQRHFAYTTAAAANGLCSASDLATKASDTASASTYLTHGQMARDALIAHMRGPSGALGQSPESIGTGSAWLDASPIEAFNWGLLDAQGPTAQATMSAMLANLVPASGRGFMRDQTGAYYDSQEWIFVDLRSERAFELAGNTTFSSGLFAWNTGQASDNYGELSELHDAITADYAGAAPMVGFGAGAYILALAARGTPVTPVCGAFAAEPGLADAGGVDAAVPPADAGSNRDAAVGRDGGIGRDSGASVDAGTSRDGSAVVSRNPPDSGEPDGSSNGASSGGCSTTGRSELPDLAGFASPFALAALLGLARRPRKARSAA